MSKCECKVVRKFALKTKKSMHSLCPIDNANKPKIDKIWLLDNNELELKNNLWFEFRF